ncbi:hypothetical protein N665_0271s0028 [Sinapis alba]|nr:hypothetical protein N665_0271s0028 [Sinapis alba]
MFVYWIVVLLLVVSAAAAEEGNNSVCSAAVNSATDLKYKILAIFSTLIVGVFGVCWPIFDFGVDGFFYACLRQFGAYVMLLASLLYILHDATESLTSSCIRDFQPWGDFPMTRVVARAAAILTMIESKSFASAFMNSDDHVDFTASQEHSVSRQDHNKTRQKKLLTQAKFDLKKTLIMVIVFSLTTPLGIGIGIAVAEIYYKNAPSALIVSGFLNAAASEILLFMTGLTGYNLKPHSIFTY